MSDKDKDLDAEFWAWWNTLTDYEKEMERGV